MIIVTLTNITNLNNSLQVGDYIYYAKTVGHPEDREGKNTIGNQYADSGKLGILRRITIDGTTVTLDVDNSMVFYGNTNPYIPQNGDFLMFSKYNQTDGDLTGYFAEVEFMWENYETGKKAELFSIGSEVVINSK